MADDGPPRMAVLTNPRARRNRRNPRRIESLRAILGDLGDVFAPDGFDALQEVLQVLRQQEVQLLVVDGGDGTLHRVLTGVCHAWGDAPWPQFAILRSGTMNIVAASIGARGRPDQALRRLVHALREGHSLDKTRRWALRVDDRLGFIFGNGIVARYLEVHYEGGGSPLNAARLLGLGALSALVGGPLSRRLTRPWHGELVLDGASYGRRDWTAVAIGTVEQIGLGFRPFPDVATHPGKAQVVQVGAGVGTLAMDLHNILLGRHLQRPGNRTTLANTIELHGRDGLDYMLDGDFYRGAPTVVITTERPVEFVLPA